MNDIFDMMDDEKRVSFDKNYIEELYLKYMAAGKTVLGAINGSAQNVILDAHCGLVGAAGNYNKLAENMLELIHEKEQLTKYGENGREYFKKNFTKQLYVDKTIAILNKLVGAE